MNKIIEFNNGVRLVRLPNITPWDWEKTILRNISSDEERLLIERTNDVRSNLNLTALKKAAKIRKKYDLDTSGLKCQIMTALKRSQMIKLHKMASPFEKLNSDSIYEQHRREMIRIEKKLTRIVEHMGLSWVPDGTFFGNWPKEWDYILVENEPNVRYLADVVLPKLMQ